MKVNKNTNKKITLKEFRELHSKRQSKTLTPYEKQKIRYKLKKIAEQNILIHLYTKFLYFGMKEFNQRKYDIKVEVGFYTDATMTINLKSLERKGYITQEFKQVKGKNYNRTHFNINIEKMNEFLTIGDDLKPENFSRLIETLRRQNEVVKPNPFDTTKKKNTPKVETTDNIVDTITIEDNKLKTVEITDNMNDSSNYDDDDSNDELKGVDFEDDKTDDELIDNDVKEVIRPVKEPIEEIKTAEEPLNEIEIINNKNENDTTIMRETNNETLPINTDTDDDDDNIELNERTRLILKYKDYEGVKPVLKDLMLSTETINELCSDDYKIGLDEKLDDKKATLDILFDVFIKSIIKKENG